MKLAGRVPTSFGVAVGLLVGGLIGVSAFAARVLLEGPSLPTWGWPFLISVIGGLTLAVLILVLHEMRKYSA